MGLVGLPVCSNHADRGPLVRFSAAEITHCTLKGKINMFSSQPHVVSMLFDSLLLNTSG